MLSRLDLRGHLVTAPEELPRAHIDVAAGVEAVRPICADVADRGVAAVRDWTERLDGVRLTHLRVPQDALDKALAELDPTLRTALAEAERRCRLVHRAQQRDDVSVEVSPGLTVTERWVPVQRVGLYVPGGLVSYPSSVVMNVVPAQEAGVPSIALASPPQSQHDGLPHPVILATCALLGVSEVYAVGGAQAVAMFAYGVEGCERVDLVTGPGNVYVTAAKRLLKGTVGIDLEAGPTEIAILADETADPDYIAADLIGQAEHDELAACLFVTDSPLLVEAVDASLKTQIETTRHRDRVVTALTNQSACVLVDDMSAGLEVIDAWAPEHLEVITARARDLASQVHNAGAIFVGPYSPVSLGDYLAGSNHVLPTGGIARYSGGLSVQSFLRGIHVVECDRAALVDAEPHIAALGGAEELAAHVAAVRVRVTGAAGE